MKKILSVLGLFVLLTACGQKEINEEQELIRPVKVETSSKSKDNLNLRFSGSLRPAVESVLSFKIPGTIQNVYAGMGDRVEKGKLLAKLDESAYTLQVQQAEAALEQAKAGVLQVDSKIAEAKTGIAQAKTGILQASSAIDRAQAAYNQAASVQNNAKQDFERYRQLFLNDNIAQSIYDAAKSGKDQAEAAVEQAKAAIEQAKAAYEQTLAQKEQAEAGLEQAKAAKIATQAQIKAVEKQLELAQLQLSYTELKAPISGTIALRINEANQNIGAGSPIFRLDAGKQLEAEIYVSESVINKIKVGDVATISIESLDIKVNGLVTEVSNSSTGFGGTYAVKINIDKVDKRLKAGMAVEVRLQSKQIEQVITLPLIAINEDSSGKKFVYIVTDIENEQGIIEKRDIKIGKLINNRIEVLSGINEDEKIVVAGVSRVIPGQKVSIYKEVK